MRLVCGPALAIVAFGFVSSANAVPIALDFSATTFAEFGAPALNVVGHVVYDSEQAPFNSFPVGDGTIAEYQWTSWEMSINGVSTPIDPLAFSALEVANDISDPYSARDRFAGGATLASALDAGALSVRGVNFSWEDVLGEPTDVLPSALSSTALPTATSDLAGFGPSGVVSLFALDSAGQGYGLFGIISTFSIAPVATKVPEPATLWLLATGLVAAAALRSQRR